MSTIPLFCCAFFIEMSFSRCALGSWLVRLSPQSFLEHFYHPRKRDLLPLAVPLFTRQPRVKCTIALLSPPFFNFNLLIYLKDYKGREKDPACADSGPRWTSKAGAGESQQPGAPSGSPSREAESIHLGIGRELDQTWSSGDSS